MNSTSLDISGVREQQGKELLSTHLAFFEYSPANFLIIGVNEKYECQE